MKNQKFLIIILLIILLILFVLFLLYKKTNNDKISFLFLIYDDIHHEELWKTFFEKADPTKYSIYIHYKNYKKSEYFDRFKLKYNIPTKWGDKSLVQAHNLLLKNALTDLDNKHFILLSGACVPFKNFDFIYNFLHGSPYSYFNFSNNSNPDRYNYAINFIPSEIIKKSHQWSILSRKHAQILVNNETEYIDWFPVVPDEHSHITFLSYRKLMPETKNYKVTFTNWLLDNGTLKNYSYISPKEIEEIYKSEHLFGRKFNRDCDLSYLNRLIN